MRSPGAARVQTRREAPWLSHATERSSVLFRLSFSPCFIPNDCAPHQFSQATPSFTVSPPVNLCHSKTLTISIFRLTPNWGQRLSASPSLVMAVYLHCPGEGPPATRGLSALSLV